MPKGLLALLALLALLLLIAVPRGYRNRYLVALVKGALRRLAFAREGVGNNDAVTKISATGTAALTQEWVQAEHRRLSISFTKLGHT